MNVCHQIVRNWAKYVPVEKCQWEVLPKVICIGNKFCLVYLGLYLNTISIAKVI